MQAATLDRVSQTGRRYRSRVGYHCCQVQWKRPRSLELGHLMAEHSPRSGSADGRRNLALPDVAPTACHTDLPQLRLSARWTWLRACLRQTRFLADKLYSLAPPATATERVVVGMPQALTRQIESHPNLTKGACWAPEIRDFYPSPLRGWAPLPSTARDNSRGTSPVTAAPGGNPGAPNIQRWLTRIDPNCGRN